MLLWGVMRRYAEKRQRKRSEERGVKDECSILYDIMRWEHLYIMLRHWSRGGKKIWGRVYVPIWVSDMIYYYYYTYYYDILCWWYAYYYYPYYYYYTYPWYILSDRSADIITYALFFHVHAYTLLSITFHIHYIIIYVHAVPTHIIISYY